MKSALQLAFTFVSAASFVVAGPIIIAPPTGTTYSYFTSFSGTTSGFMATIAGHQYATGTISYSLDTTFGTDNFDRTDWDTGTVSIRLHLLLEAPILSTLGLSPVPIEINESGPLSSIPNVEWGKKQMVSLTSVLAGGGTIDDPGNPFDGTIYTNFEDKTDSPVINVNITGNAVEVGTGTAKTSNKGNVQQKGESKQETSGSASGTTAGIPEPASLILMLTGLGALGAWSRKVR